MNDAAPRYRGRFAPSPTGALHFGSLVTALGSWLRARQRDGAWVIRIEDLDPPREVAGAADQQVRMLQAFGLMSDEKILRQSERIDLYRTELRRLDAAGVVFECRCSRSDLARQAGLHQHCSTTIEPGRLPALRARVPDLTVEFLDAIHGAYGQQLRRDVGDFVLLRVEGLIAYQLAVVVDDQLQGISEIVRGSDLLDSTPRQIWLQRLLGYATPDYAHLPLVLDDAGQKLGKSHASLPLDADDPLPALRAAWRFLGQDERRLKGIASRDALLRTASSTFELARVPLLARSFMIQTDTPTV